MSLEPNHDRSSSPSIGIYTGTGASHSWLWFVEVLDRENFCNLHFVTEEDLRSQGLDSLDVLLMSGGDTFAIAEALGAEGSNRLKRFIEDGGIYIGSCAGAYLPLRSSMNFLNQFNYIDVKISNISRRLTVSERQSFERTACSSYGCDFVFHVVREDIVLRMLNGYQRDGKKEMIAPLYGGPSMLPSEDVEPIATYRGFTQKTKFLVSPELAEKTLIGNIAVAKKSIGKGQLYIFGPHFEHPHYPSCNHFLTEIIRKQKDGRGQTFQEDFSGNSAEKIKGEELKELLRDLKRELSNSRIMVSGMDLSAHWLIGNKYYEPEKINVFINTVWKKLRIVESMYDLEVDETSLLQCVEISKEITTGIKAIRSQANRQGDATPMAADLFLKLKILSSCFFELYFGLKRDRFRHSRGNQWIKSNMAWS